MITSLKPWKSKAELEAYLVKHADVVYVAGKMFSPDTIAPEPWDKPLSALRYKQTVVAEHKGIQYAFRVGTNGKIHVD